MGTIYLIGYKRNVDTDTIIWIEGYGNYTKVHFLSGETSLITQTLKWFERNLGNFIRINKSALVNPLHIDWLEQPSPNHAAICLFNGIELILSRRRIKPIVARLKTLSVVKREVTIGEPMRIKKRPGYSATGFSKPSDKLMNFSLQRKRSK
ncbi:hypothetical protein GCM10023189_43460 [Nibrella saemangeumensis]|uniref:HTH LytTR-type domain-containing protein n=1 Tax=Nibrella saemangeumensis TaxID=1084526 RepID=A0ABP8NFB4_9BACT